MFKTFLTLSVLCFAADCVPAAKAQPAQTVYTYVAEYGLPRASWDDFVARWQKVSVPVLDRLVADGSIIEYGASATVVHHEGAPTHSLWWAANTFAGTQRVLAELAKSGPPPAAIPGTTHRDRLLRSVVYRAGKASQTGGFSELSMNVVKPGKAQLWRETYDKYTKPVLEKLFAEGTITGYGVDQEHVHTENLGARFEWIMYPSAEAIDKANAAFAADREKRTADERSAITAAYRDIFEPGAHRDGLDRVIRWVHK